MAIPGRIEIPLPLLKALSDGKVHSVNSIIDVLAQEFSLSSSERMQSVPSGAPVFDTRIRWAFVDLKIAKLLSSPSRGYIQITERGIDVLSKSPEKIDSKFLMQFPEFEQKLSEKKQTKDLINTLPKSDKPYFEHQKAPEEIFEETYTFVSAALVENLLERVKQITPARFERLVVDLLGKMGYGGALSNAGSITKLSGDEGIDGVIKEDKLGLDMIYLQAKRWKETTVGRPEIQKFVGALAGQKASKGVFITTSAFTKEAREYAANLQQKVVLIDGEQLAELMIEYDLGVSIAQTYLIKRVDNDYFDENLD